MTTIETEIDLAKKLLNLRMLAKQVGQLSYELREIDKAFPADYYEFNNAEKMIELYGDVLEKVVKLGREIEASR